MPNPVTDQVQFNCEESFIGVNLVLIENTGRIVLQLTISSVEFTIDLSHLETGNYQLKVGKTENRIERIVKL
jgi:hypothetical protein